MAYELCSIDDVKAYLGRTTHDDDALLTTFVSSVSASFEAMVGRLILSRTYTGERQNGYYGRAIVPRQYPVTAVSQVKIDDEVIAESTAFDANGWTLADDVIRLRNMYVNAGIANVSITYTAGYASIPSDIRMAIAEWVSIKYRERTHIGTQSQSMSGVSLSYLPSVIPQSVMNVAATYKRLV